MNADEQRRAEALRMAMQFLAKATGPSSSEQLLKVAGEFDTFMKGDKEAEPDAAE